jgi:hypothetical protein
VREKEVGNIASADSQQIAEYIRKVNCLDQERSNTHVTDHGNGPGAAIETHKSPQGLFFSERSVTSPCPALVPEKIVNQGTLDGNQSGKEIVHFEEVSEQDQNRNLNTNTHYTNRIVSKPFAYNSQDSL